MRRIKTICVVSSLCIFLTGLILTLLSGCAAKQQFATPSTSTNSYYEGYVINTLPTPIQPQPTTIVPPQLTGDPKGKFFSYDGILPGPWNGPVPGRETVPV